MQEGSKPQRRTPRISELAPRWIIEEFAPATVIVNRRCEVLFLCGDTPRYLHMRHGEPSLDLLDMVREGLLTRVRTCVRSVFSTGEPAEVGPARMRLDGGYVFVRIRAKPLHSGGRRGETLAMVSFDEPPAHEPASDEGSAVQAEDESMVRELEHELQATREDLQSTIEVLETSNEELKASNEEVTSMNEELQSANQELESSREELHSLNQELTTVNQQLQDKLHELEEANDDLSNFLDSSRLAMVFLDEQLRVRRFTAQASSLFRLRASDIGRPLSDIATELDTNALTQTAHEVLSSGRRSETIVHSDDGRWHSQAVVPYHSSASAVDGVVISFADVTRLHASERRAREHLTQLETIYSQTPAALGFLDGELRFRRVNAELERFTGLTAGELLGHQPQERLSRDLGGRLQWLLEQVAATHQAVEGVELSGELGGSPRGERDWLASVLPVRDEEGELHGFSLRLDDCTERKRDERHLAAAREVSAALLSAGDEEQVIDASLAAVGTHFAARICEYWVPVPGTQRFRCAHFEVPHGSEELEKRLREVFDESLLSEQDALVGPTWRESSPHWIDDLDSREDFERAPEARELGLVSGFALPVVGGERRYGVMCFFTGTPLSVNAVLTGSLAALGRDIGNAIGRHRDTERLRREDERKSRFLSVLGHELRNPLSSISNAVELLARRSDRSDWELTVLLDSVSTMSRLLDDLLDLERISQGKIELRHQQVDLASCARQASLAVRNAVAEKRQQLSLSLPSPSLLVRGDPVRLEQIVSNLLQNASKYTPEGGRIELLLDAEGEEAVVRVNDDGRGIDPGSLESIFEPFVQLPLGKPSHSGLGIGLALVRQLVELHGGSIQAHSDGEGKGASFTLRLPLVERREERAGPVPRRADTDETQDLSGLRVLLVDDNESSTEALSALLSDWGCEARVAYNGEQAIARAREGGADVFILDLGLPDIDGTVLAGRLREDGAQGALMVALSGYGDPAARAATARAGFDHHLTKPARLDQLRPILASARSARDG